MLPGLSVVSSPCSCLMGVISWVHSSGISISMWSSRSAVFNQSGPLIHDCSSRGVRPRDGPSAGLSLPAQCLHSCGGVSAWISDTLFWTKGFQTLSVPRIQYTATVESEKQCGLVSGSSSSRALDTLSIRRASSSAASSSNLGMVQVLSGATLVLDATILTCLSSGVSKSR